MVRNVIVTALLAVVLLLSIFPGVEHAGHEWWEQIPAFEALFGFFGCVAIIFVSKGFGRLFVQKKEDYYDE